MPSTAVVLDRRFVWHPFTQMKDWMRSEPIVLVKGRGARLWDEKGREYLDANSSIWTNLHGHRNPRLDAAIVSQLRKVAHVSALGFANEPASHLAAELVRVANPLRSLRPKLSRVFFSDDGSTAMEVALKQAYETARRSRGHSKPRFLTVASAYHGDTIGATSLGHIPLFHRTYRDLLFQTDAVMSPYCYRCPFNRAKPERGDARTYRKCGWECAGQVEEKFSKANKSRKPYSAFVVEPRIQGAAGMIAQPAGWLKRTAAIARAYNAFLIADEVMTGFGRTGGVSGAGSRAVPALFACHAEGVQPDFMVLAKGLTGGYLPMAATLTSDAVFNAFLGEYEDFKTFFHGHSFTANPLGAAVGLESLRIFQESAEVGRRTELEKVLDQELASLWKYPNVGDIRREGLVAGVELVRDWTTRDPFDLREQMGIRVCREMAALGVLTRPIGNVIVLMPPYVTTPRQLRRMVGALRDALAVVTRR